MAVIAVGGTVNPRPLAPTLQTPISGSFQDLAGPSSFTWQYNPAQAGLSQTGWKFDRRTNNSSAQQFWNATTGTWGATPVFNSGVPAYGTLTTQNPFWTYTFPAGAFIDGNVYQWAVASADSNGNGPISPYSLVTAQQPPVVTVSTPTGTVTQANPTIAWSTMFAPGATQLTYQVWIYTDAQVVPIPPAVDFVPGQSPYLYTTNAIGSNTANLDLTNIPLFLPTGVTYYAFVQVSETHGLLSDLTLSGSYTTFTTLYDPPATSALTALATVDGVTGCPLVELSTSAGASLVGDAVIQRSDGAYVRGASINNPYVIPGTGIITVYDYEAVPSIEYTYTLQILVTTGTSTVASDIGTSNSVMLMTDRWWELDPNNPAGAINAQVIGWQPVRTEQSTARLVLGQVTPNVVTSTMGGIDGQATFETFDPTTYQSLQGVLTSQTTIFVSSPWGPTDTSYVRFGPQSGGGGGAGGSKVVDSTLLPSTYANMHRTTQVTWVAQARPPV